MSLEKLNRRFEEHVTIINQQDATAGSGGIAWISSGITGAKVVWMPDSKSFIWDENGRSVREMNVLQVSKTQWNKTPFEVGKTIIKKNGNLYRVVNAIDYRHLKPISCVEVEVVRMVKIVE